MCVVLMFLFYFYLFTAVVVEVKPGDVLVSQAEEECVDGLNVLCDVIGIAGNPKDSGKVVAGGLADKVGGVDHPAHRKADDDCDEGEEREGHHEAVVDNAELAGRSNEAFGLLGVLLGPPPHEPGQDDVAGDVDCAADVGDEFVAEGEAPRILEVVDGLNDRVKHYFCFAVSV